VKVGCLNGEKIDVKQLASNFAVDAFTTASFSMNMTADEPIADFDKVRDWQYFYFIHFRLIFQICVHSL